MHGKPLFSVLKLGFSKMSFNLEQSLDFQKKIIVNWPVFDLNGFVVSYGPKCSFFGFFPRIFREKNGIFCTENLNFSTENTRKTRVFRAFSVKKMPFFSRKMRGKCTEKKQKIDVLVHNSL